VVQARSRVVPDTLEITGDDAVAADICQRRGSARWPRAWTRDRRYYGRNDGSQLGAMGGAEPACFAGVGPLHYLRKN